MIRIILFVLTCCGMAAIPAVILSGAIHPDYLAMYGLAGLWIALLIIALCTGDDPDNVTSR